MLDRYFGYAAPLLLAAPMALVACSGESASKGHDQPLVVRNGQFFEGAMPNDKGSLSISDVSTLNSIVQQGYAGKKIQGHATLGKDKSGEATVVGESVGIELTVDGFKKGYWVVVMEGEDINQPGYSLFDAVFDFSSELQPGKYEVKFAAVDAEGKFGAPYTSAFTVVSDVPTNATMVATLDWDNAADLDLHVLGPDGKELSPKTPNTGTVSSSTTTDSSGKVVLSGNGYLNRDSNAQCVQDGYRKERVIWTDAPLSGYYQFVVHEFSACGTVASDFQFTVKMGDKTLISSTGRVLNIDADGNRADGTETGLYMGYLTCDGKGSCK